MNIDSLLDAYRVDKAHARHVADLALTLYEVAHEPCDLPDEVRRLLEMSALLHNIGLTTDPEQHHLVGRDIVLRHVIEGVSPSERSIIAAAVAFHRKRVRPEQEPAFLALGRKNRDLALKVAALLRVADGLDYSQSQTTRIAASQPKEDGLALQLDGPHSASDGERAAAKADLWQKILPQPITIVAEAGPANPELPSIVPAPVESGEGEAERLPPWYGDGSVPLAELCRVLLRRHFRRMLAAERQARAGDKPEAIHELRVATRRLRATLSVAAVVAPERKIRAFRKTVQQIARAAGQVRDCDVFLLDVEAEQSRLPEERQGELEPLRAALLADRQAALTTMVAAYNNEAHTSFKHEFAEFIAREDSDWNEGPQVRDIAGSMIYRQYEVLRARAGGAQLTEELLANVSGLHEVRIEAKRLRYLLESFGDIFDERLDQAIDPLMAVQDSMGVLNDSAVAEQYINALPEEAREQPAIRAYLAHRTANRASVLAEFTRRWEKIVSATYRRTLMGLIVKL
jgi:CHAD domain-containing protein